MEQLLTFFLGVFSVVVLLAVGIAFRIRKEIQDYRNQDEDIKMNFERDIWDAIDNIDRRIDQEIDRTDRSHENTIRNIDDFIDNLNKRIDVQAEDAIKYTDSRIDKLTDLIKAEILEDRKNTELISRSVEKLQHKVADVEVTIQNM